jgi:hypothetical protein
VPSPPRGGFSEPTATAPLGVPVGVEFLARPFDEPLLLGAGRGYEPATGTGGCRPTRRRSDRPPPGSGGEVVQQGADVDDDPGQLGTTWPDPWTVLVTWAPPVYSMSPLPLTTAVSAPVTRTSASPEPLTVTVASRLSSEVPS